MQRVDDLYMKNLPTVKKVCKKFNLSLHAFEPGWDVNITLPKGQLLSRISDSIMGRNCRITNEVMGNIATSLGYKWYK